MNDMTPIRPLDSTDMDAVVLALGAAEASNLAALFHPYANAFPLMPAAEQDSLGNSMAEGGQREAIVIYDQLILDGRNRAIQCKRLGITPRVRPYDPKKDGPDPLRFVEDMNLKRRHLSASQRAMAAAEMETFRQGRPRRDDGKDANLHLFADGALTHEPTRADLAGRYSVSTRMIADAATVRDAGAPELKEAVKAGEIAADAAADLTLAPAHRQSEMLAALPRDDKGELTPDAKRQVRALAKELREKKNAEKKAKRKTREKQLGDKIAAMPDELFGFILEDPEWQFTPWSTETGMDRAADNHYPTSADETLLTERAAAVAKLAAENSVLGMWTTDLARGIEAMRKRGFTPKSYTVWVKNVLRIDLTDDQRAQITVILGREIPAYILLPVGARGTGYWVADEDEIFLIGTRGNPVCPAMGEQGGSVWYEPKREHSQKPECSYAWIEKHFPNTPRIELNARRRRAGWQVWGNEVEPAPRAIVDLEREACARGLVSETGIVQTEDGPAPSDQLNEADWRSVLARAALANDVGEAESAIPIRAAHLRAESDAPLYGVPHTVVTEAEFPALHRAFELISHDSGAGAGHERYPVPLAHCDAATLKMVDGALDGLDPSDLETFCIGEEGEQADIRDRCLDPAAIATTQRLLDAFFSGFFEETTPATAGDDPLDIPAFLRRTAN